MKQTIALLICSFVFGCTSEIKPKKSDLSDINLVLQTDTKIDSVWISNIGQTESFFLPLKDTIKVNFEEKLNDLYNIAFYTENGRKANQIWLNGNNVIVNAKLTDKIEIDSVINSDLYYRSINFSKNYGELIQNKSDSTAIDKFLLENISQNIQSPFSFAVANTFIHRNQNNKAKIGKLFDILSTQSDTLKNHLISIHGKIENILKVNFLNTGDYKFANIDNQLSSINIEKSKMYLLDFWFVNCPPCIRDHKLISKKLGLLKEKKVELIGISTDRNHSVWKEYLKKQNYNWKNYREIDSLKRVTKDMAIWSFPTYLLLKSNGEIKARYNSFRDFEKALE
ncbi:TlpA family protein disulfide reductase [Flagellimonas marinaquae]|uniref:TlpA family protein disulfide reductase n=1 Tax=Flagellimonas marinaquae TaxID=254955 RepID=UPI000F8DD2DB|nr:TlpA disulfide reductase family protein [Allomuricauda aquimarina]